MALGTTRSRSLLVLSLVLAGCGGSSSVSPATVDQVLQDLGVDPDGTTTVVTFSRQPGTLTPGNFEADGGQLATGVSVAGRKATVQWDERVTPEDRVKVVGSSAIEKGYRPVSTSDASAATFAVASATQVPGLGGDTVSVQFSGPRVVEADAEDPSNWRLRVGGTEMDLSGSTFDLAPATQVLSVTLGSAANLHATFELAAADLETVAGTSLSAAFVGGAATGDADPPSLVSAIQNLAEDEFGRVVDFTFDEAMDPVFAAQMSNFDAGFPVFASAVEQPSDAVLRVTFTEPRTATVDSVDALVGLLDAHGNALDNPGAVVVAQGATVANGFASNPTLVTAENAGGDTLQVVFTQALDPEDAVDHTRWSLDVDATPVDLSLQAFDFDLEAKTLTIAFADDYATGVAFDLQPAGGNEPLDVDGEAFVSTFVGVVTGDATAPTVTQVVQNRATDPAGTVVDVHFSEDVDQLEAENAANYAVSGGLTVLGAMRLPSLEVVQLTLDGLAVPGDVTVDVSVVEDLAGNGMAPVAGLALVSSDEDAPVATVVSASAPEGADNDELVVRFDDEMLEAEVETEANWAVESPVGNPLTVTGNVTIDYVPASRTATLTFVAGGVNFQTGDDVGVAFTGMRDYGGNTVDSEQVTGLVDVESDYPTLESVWVETLATNRVHVRFSEPVQFLDDVYDADTNPDGHTHYVLRDAGGTQKGLYDSFVADADGLGGAIVFTAGATAFVDTLDVRGIADLAGNPLFPLFDVPISAEDSSGPGFDPGLSVAATVPGEDNDIIVLTFDRPLSSWGVEDPANYEVELGGNFVDLSAADIDFDGDRTVTFDLTAQGSDFLSNGQVYDVRADNLMTAQGVEMGAQDADTMTPFGDAVAPDLPLLRTRLDATDAGNSVLLEMTEAIDPADLADVLNVDISGTNPDTVTVLGHRSVRATWAGGVTAGQVVNVDYADLAGNGSGLVSRAIQGVDTSGPVVVSVAGVATSGVGGDWVSVQFDFPPNVATASDTTNYTVEQGGESVDLGGAWVRYSSTDATVYLMLADGVELDAQESVRVTVDGVTNHAGITISPAADVVGSMGGDAVAPELDSAFVNYREDATGMTVDVRFDEAVGTAVAGDPVSWSVTSGQLVEAVEVLTPQRVRLTLDSTLVAGDELVITGVADLAQNVAGELRVEPVQ